MEVLLPDYLAEPVLQIYGLMPGERIPSHTGLITRTMEDNTKVSQKFADGVMRLIVARPEEPVVEYETSPPFNPTQIIVHHGDFKRQYWIRPMVTGIYASAVQSELAGHANALAAKVEAERVAASGLAQAALGGAKPTLSPPLQQV